MATTVDLSALTDLIAERVAARVAERLSTTAEDATATEIGWLDSRAAARYLGLSLAALDKLAAARRIPFEQDGRGAKRWFQRAQLDAWRQGR